jgi:hypothetical protein
MTTKTPTRVGRSLDPAPPLPLITAEGVAAYVRCRREWWLAEVHEQAPGAEARAARASLMRRQALARTLAMIGGGLMVLAILLVAAALVLG